MDYQAPGGGGGTDGFKRRKMALGLGPFAASLVAGSAAGTAVDMILFPLDTIKTRLQSKGGFWKSGGFSGIYRGIAPAFVGSAPNAAVFFCTYDTSKRLMEQFFKVNGNSGVHMAAASFGEIFACVVRVPVEIVKQRQQTSKSSALSIITKTLKGEGVRGFYRGYFSTILREIPFSVIQFPLWEGFKSQVVNLRESICGAFAGGIAASLTTPLDVAKTRIMLADVSSVESRGSLFPVWKIIYRENGVRGLFAGVLPRTLWISFGGFIFFGTYEVVKKVVFGTILCAAYGTAVRFVWDGNIAGDELLGRDQVEQDFISSLGVRETTVPLARTFVVAFLCLSATKIIQGIFLLVAIYVQSKPALTTWMVFEVCTFVARVVVFVLLFTLGNCRPAMIVVHSLTFGVEFYCVMIVLLFICDLKPIKQYTKT
ncbi:S-adenosylmethionine mitochondrial carrier protein [Orchesella cincta]|uniref:S-adenosylmethionine mitochondrial carrier protein n=1 Tax=Orchesella cincta TaxID=48709 RepID=A0A1D2N4G6_ORCCI|nr:S-adenosylmethionine mitochondrial carrier protein [Orchesella cincta]